MVHLRLNEKETNPNPYINFITALPGSGDERARQLLRALAAQLKPVMKSHGFTVNSFEEVRVIDDFPSSWTLSPWLGGDADDLTVSKKYFFV